MNPVNQEKFENFTTFTVGFDTKSPLALFALCTCLFITAALKCVSAYSVCISLMVKNGYREVVLVWAITYVINVFPMKRSVKTHCM